MLLFRFLGLHRVDEQLTTRMFTALEFSLTVFMGTSAKGIIVIVYDANLDVRKLGKIPRFFIDVLQLEFILV